MHSYDSAPIFIIGVHRSGTTLLRYMLNSHPRIYIPPESDFFPRFFRKNPHEKLTRKQIANILKTIFNQYRFVREWEGAPLESDAFEGETTPSVFLDTLYSAYARQKDAVRWGDKTPIYSSYVDLLDKLFPKGQFIHLIRDGRDVGLSMLEKWGDEMHFDIYFTARNWEIRTRQARSAARFGSNRYFELHYEDLVANPKRELQAVCRFLGEDYLPIMAQPHKRAQRDIEPGSFHAAIRKPPSTQRVARWEQEMSPKDQRLFQHAAERLLAELGYPVKERSPMSFGEKMRLTFYQTKYHVLQWGRRVLQTLGFFYPN